MGAAWQTVGPNDWFSGVAADSEVTIACLGISQLIEGEEGESIMSRHFGDREDIALPQSQIDFLKNIRGKAKKLVVVLTGGSAIACPEVYEMADALLFAWYPGEQGGLAVGNTIFGKSVPSGKLPVTFPKSVEDLPPYEDYAMTNRTYRYMKKEPLFPFGFGLSYTSFSYADIALEDEVIKSGERTTVTARVSNIGKYIGEEVVQLYITDLQASVEVPQYALKGFKRIRLKPGETKTVEFEVLPEFLSLINNEGDSILEKGEFLLSISSSVPIKRSLQLGAPWFTQTTLKVK